MSAQEIEKEEPKRDGEDLLEGVWLSLQRENQRFGELHLRPASGWKGELGKKRSGGR